MGRHAQPLAERFWSKVDKRGADECWPWTGSRFSTGYGQIYVNGHKTSAHRVAFELTTNVEPLDLDVCHTCDNPQCCNPAHLFIGTTRDNMLDKVRKGRANVPHGEQSGTAKLTENDICEIRALRQLGLTHRCLAQNYGVSQPAITYILNGKTWNHVNR